MKGSQAEQKKRVGSLSGTSGGSVLQNETERKVEAGECVVFEVVEGDWKKKKAMKDSLLDKKESNCVKDA